MVEAAGIEPASEGISAETSTRIVRHLISPPVAPADRVNEGPALQLSSAAPGPGAINQSARDDAPVQPCGRGQAGREA